MRRPIIGVTLGDGDEADVRAIRKDYLRSVAQAGAVAVALPPTAPEDAPRLLERLDGLLLSGGGDLDPALYGREPHAKLGRVDRERDDFEIALLAEALRRDRPVLAICRGLQLLNVATGGTLVQDIPSQWGGAVSHDSPGPRGSRTHEVRMEPDTRLRAILDRDTVRVNSFHHQAVEQVGEGLRVSARCSEDGMVEGLEAPARRFLVAVQWHAEAFWSEADSFQRLFDAHAEACRS